MVQPAMTEAALRVSAHQALQLLKQDENALILDARSAKAWRESNEQIAGARRVDPERLQVDPAWRKDAFILTYCT